MVVHPDPDTLCAAGRRFLEQGRYREALAAAKAALAARPDEPRYLSIYGLCLVKRGHDVLEGRKLCERAAREGFYRPEVMADLARALLWTGDRPRAEAAARKGLRVDPGNRELIRLLAEMGIRRRPVFPFLHRRHPLNRMVGRVRHRLFGVGGG